MNTPFWMVFVEGGHLPVKKHHRKELASEEAERLARLNPGKNVHVLESIATAVLKPYPVSWDHVSTVAATD